MRYLIKETIEVAHHLPWHRDGKKSGKCSRPHGHSYHIEIHINLSVNLRQWASKGVPVDFGEVKKLVRKFDHQNLNDFLPNPTAENFALLLKDGVEELVSRSMSRSLFTGAFVEEWVKVRVWETEGCMVEV